jgi:hypothetical protein
VSNQFKYNRDELERAYESKSAFKKFTNLTKKGKEFFIGEKKIVPVVEHSKFLKRYYNNPETGFKGRDRLASFIVQDYIGISCWDTAKWLSNLETHQIHQETKDVKISRPVVLQKEGTWAIDLTWLKEVDSSSITTVEKDLQVYLL